MSQPKLDKSDPSLDQPTKREALKDEYLQLQKTIEDFNQQSLTIKNWSVVFGFASIGVAFTTHREWVLIVSALSAGTFWILEAQWKTFQNAYYERVYHIEAYFRGDRTSPEPFRIPDTLEPFQIAASWHASWTKNWPTRFFKILLTWPWVYLPHLVVILIALTLFALVKLSPFDV
jgi:hypothetical protein